MLKVFLEVSKRVWVKNDKKKTNFFSFFSTKNFLIQKQKHSAIRQKISNFLIVALNTVKNFAKKFNEFFYSIQYLVQEYIHCTLLYVTIHCTLLYVIVLLHTVHVYLHTLHVHLDTLHCKFTHCIFSNLN